MSTDHPPRKTRTPAPPSPKGSGLVRAASIASSSGASFLGFPSPHSPPLPNLNSTSYFSPKEVGAYDPYAGKRSQGMHDPYPSTSRKGSIASLEGVGGVGGGAVSDTSSNEGPRKAPHSKLRKMSESFVSLAPSSTKHRPSMDSFESIRLPPSPGVVPPLNQRSNGSAKFVPTQGAPPPNPMGPLPVPVRKASKQAQLLGGDFDGDFEGDGMANGWAGWGGKAPDPANDGQPMSPNSRVGVEDIAPWDFTEEVSLVRWGVDSF